MDQRLRFLGSTRGAALAPDATGLARLAEQWPTPPLELWSVDEQRPWLEFGAVDSTTSLAIPPDSQCVLVMGWQTVGLICPTEGESRAVDLGRKVSVGGDRPLGFSPDGSRFGVSTGFPDPEVLVANLTEGRLVWSLRGEEASFREVTALTFSPDDQSVAVAVETPDYKSAVLLLRAGDGAPLRTIRDERGDSFASITGLVFSPDSSQLAIGRRDGQVELRRLADWTIVRTLVGHRRPVKHLFFTRNESIVTASEDGAVLVWTR
jgi:hypothetical protein